MKRRRSAVPLAIESMNRLVPTGVVKKRRKLKASGVDPDTRRVLNKLAENRMRIETLERGVWECADIDCSEVIGEIDLLRSNIELGLVEIAGGLDEVPTSEEVLAEAMA
ncbi:MAG: hypothetical protein JSV90_08075 [Methanobacteriota archaeon]|nr:MAG: hypothetical protein JSV90_08075 [Euryarchaeota archaeon]